LPGLATQGGTGTSQHVDGLLDAFFDEDKGRPRLVHRLDKDTSGVLLIARSPGAAAKFSKSFSGREARKTYWALVVGVPDIASGRIDLPIGKQPGSGGEKMHVDEENGQSARTRYRVIERAGNAAAFVELQPLTGRTHQLRVHMAAIGHPIVGDGKYGGKAAFLTGTISRKLHLHARRLRIAHPAGGELDVTAPLCDHFAESMTDLGFEEAAGDAMAQRPDKIVPAADAKIRVDARANRRARKGERRSRGADAPSPTRTGKPQAKPAARPGAKPAARPGLRPGPRPPRPAGGKSGGGKPRSS
jgi:23S rRNA pseudouridine955/2504/2580 synthase